jgi:acetylornithine deacetylase/succinyl-diaminopimelate desuccinylase-like protein
VTFRLDRRLIPEELPEAVEAELREMIAEAGAAFPEANIVVRRILLVRPLVPVEAGRRLTERLTANATRIMGEAIGEVGVPLYTDAPHYAERGIPIVLYGAGPHTIDEANAHRANERLPLADLRKATEVVALTLLQLLKA